MNNMDPDRQCAAEDGKAALDAKATAEANSASAKMAGERLNGAFKSPVALTASSCRLAGFAMGKPVVFGICCSWAAMRGIEVVPGTKNVIGANHHRSRASADLLEIP